MPLKMVIRDDVNQKDNHSDSAFFQHEARRSIPIRQAKAILTRSFVFYFRSEKCR